MNLIEVLERCKYCAETGVEIINDTPKAVHALKINNWHNNKVKARKLLDDLLCASHVDLGLELLFTTGAIDILFPEFIKMRNMGDEEGLHKDVWEHTKTVVKNVPNKLELRWGALMHDIGKVKTRKIERGKVTFHQHDIVGSFMFKDLNKRLQLFDKDEVLYNEVKKLILFHLRPAFYGKSWTDSAVRRLLLDCGDIKFFNKLMQLSQADLTTKIPRKRKRALTNANNLKKHVDKIIEDDNKPKLPKHVMGTVIKFVNVQDKRWINLLKSYMEMLMKLNIISPANTKEYYFIEALKIIYNNV